MGEILQLGTAEGRLCGVLAAAVARHVTRHDENVEAGRKGAVFFHMFDSSLEDATNVLIDLGLLAPEKRSDTYTPNVLTMDADAMPAFVGGTIRAGDPRIENTVAAFVNVACYFAGLSDERTPFTPPAALAESMRALSRFGYAERLGGQYRWTDKIGPAMRESYLWDAELRSQTTLERGVGASEAEAAWRTMPETIRQRFFSNRPIEFMEFLKVLAQHWRGGKWHATSREGWLHTDRTLGWRIKEIADRRMPHA